VTQLSDNIMAVYSLNKLRTFK